MIEKLLETRKRIKKRKPDFIMQDFFKRKELKKRWRRPRGMHSKMRMRKAGHPKHVEIGYSSPKLVRHLDRKGRKRILVSRTEDIAGMDKSKEAALIRHGVGLKKKIEILKAAQQKGITVINLNEEKLNKKTEARKSEMAQKKAKPKEKPAEKKEPEKKETEEEKKEEDKTEKDKILTKREI